MNYQLIYIHIRCEGKNAFTHTPRLGVVWGSKHDDVYPPNGQACQAVLPTKTSQLCIQFTGNSCPFLNAGPQVPSTSFLNLLVLTIFVVVVLLMVSLSLIAQYHLALISPSVRGFSCITLSHLRTQIRYADSDRMIWKSLVGPQCIVFCCCR